MSTEPQSQSLTKELKHMPKEPIEGMEIAFGRQFCWCTPVCLVLPGSAGFCYLCSIYAIDSGPWWTTAWFLLIVTLFMFICWFAFLVKLEGERRQLARIAAGHYLASWPIPQEAWDARQKATHAALDSACWWILRVVPAIGFVGASIGVILDIVVGGESCVDVFPVAFPYGLNAIGYAFVGLILAWAAVKYIRFIANISDADRRQRRMSGRCV